jgi:hypothetical protein
MSFFYLVGYCESANFPNSAMIDGDLPYSGDPLPFSCTIMARDAAAAALINNSSL